MAREGWGAENDPPPPKNRGTNHQEKGTANPEMVKGTCGLSVKQEDSEQQTFGILPSRAQPVWA